MCTTQELLDLLTHLTPQPGERVGQAWFRVLSYHRPELAKELAGRPEDPFYRNWVPPNSWNWLMEKL